MTDDLATLPRPAYLELIDEHRALAIRHHRRALLGVSVPWVVAFIVAVAATVAYLPFWLSIVVGAAVGTLAALAALRRATASVVARLGAPEARAGDCPRVDNVLESLALTIGVDRPTLLVVDSAAVEAMPFGTSSTRAYLAVTTALVEDLDAMETEALLAQAMVRIKDAAIEPATVAVTTLVPLARVLPPIGRALWRKVAPERAEESDFRTARVTHYPPALQAALGKVESTASRGGLPGGGAVAHLWTAPRRRDCLLPPPGVDLAARRRILDEL